MTFALLLLFLGVFTQESLSTNEQSQNILLFKNSSDIIVNQIKKSSLNVEILNIEKELLIGTPLIINFDSPQGFILFKTVNDILVNITSIANSESLDSKDIHISEKSIMKETIGFFFGDSVGQISIQAKNKNSHFSAVKIIFPEVCQKFYLQTRYDDFQINKQNEKTDLISTLSLTKENMYTCYYHDVDFFPYFVSFKFNNVDDFIKINGQITNSQSSPVEFTERSILTLEHIYFSQESPTLSKTTNLFKREAIQDQRVNMTIFTQLLNNNDISISDIIDEVTFFKGYLPNKPSFINGQINTKNSTQTSTESPSNKKKQTTAIIATILSIFVAFILCSAISYCIRKRNNCKFYNIENNDDDGPENEITENDASSSIGPDNLDENEHVEHLSNDEFENRHFLQNEFDESYPQTNFQLSQIEYKAPSQTLLATVLDEANAKI